MSKKTFPVSVIMVLVKQTENKHKYQEPQDSAPVIGNPFYLPKYLLGNEKPPKKIRLTVELV